MSQIITTDRQSSALRPTKETISEWRPMGLKNLTIGLVERGKIKIGQKGQLITSRNSKSFQPPKKLDHFTVTTTEEGADGNFVEDKEIMEMLGEKPTEIPIILIYDDIQLNFPTRQALYNGTLLQCSGDGQDGRWLNPDRKTYTLMHCADCGKNHPDYKGGDKCKLNGTLSVIIPLAKVIGGVWKFRTTSYNSISGIISSLEMIRRITGGPLAGIPLTLKLTPKKAQTPTGSAQTIYVVSIEYKGSAEDLRMSGYNTLLEQEKHGVRIKDIESEARALITRDDEELDSGPGAEDLVQEFYPEQAAAAEGLVIEDSQTAPRTFVTSTTDSTPDANAVVASADKTVQAPAPQTEQTSQQPDLSSSDDDLELF